MALLCALFLVSGGPALIYQILWQRALFAIYGIHVESVAVVVAAFLLGLGLGGIAGGAVSRRARRPLLWFGAAELTIGAFGWISLSVFRRVGDATLLLPPLATAAVTFALVVLPTVAMGATLPLLVSHLVRTSRNVGRSIGLLTFVNTIGSAAACLVGAFFLFDAFGAAASVRIAAAVNLLVALAALAWGSVERPPALRPALAASPARSKESRRAFTAALALAFAGGAVSLSYEIVWYRIFSIATGGLAAGFALVLAMFLSGLAAGALLARGLCEDEPDRPAAWNALARWIAISAVAGALLVPAAGLASERLHPSFALLFVLGGATLLGLQLPLLGHLAVRPDATAGLGVGALVLANIVGAAAGSLGTGFVLMDVLPLSWIVVLLAAVGLVVAVLVRLFAAPGPSARVRAVLFAVAAMAAVVALVLARPALFEGFWERLLFTHRAGELPRLARVVEERSGVLAVTREGDLYGGGVYDGAFSTDLVDDRNGVARAFAIPAFHPAPRDVLVIGLASGSWTAVLAGLDAVERLTAVEIDRGYLRLIPEHPDCATILTDEKVTIEIDDGRRWLSRHAERRFDAILMNTTFHWRAHASRLLSVEFLEQMRRHLKPGGLVYYNTTDSPRAQATAAAVFPHVARCRNFVLASERPLVLDRERLRTALLSVRVRGRALLDPSREGAAERLDEILEEFSLLEHDAALRARVAGVRPITDDDMGSEWRHGPDPASPP